MARHLYIIVEKSEGAEPESRHDHEQHVDVGEVSHEQARHEDGKNDYDSAHCGSASFLHLSLESEVAHDLTDLHELQPVDYTAPEHNGDEEREQQGGSGAEGDVVHQPRTGEVGLLKVFKKIVEHFLAFGFDYFTDYLAVVEMVLDAFDLHIVLMSLAGNENHCAG